MPFQYVLKKGSVLLQTAWELYDLTEEEIKIAEGES